MKEKKRPKPELSQKGPAKKKGKHSFGSNSFTVLKDERLKRQKKEERQKIAKANKRKAERAKEKKHNAEWEKTHKVKAEWRRNIKNSPRPIKIKRGWGRTVSITETQEDPLHRK